MICYDGYFGRTFESNLETVRQEVEKFNLEYRNRGYIFAREYWELINDMADDKEECRMSAMLMDNFGFNYNGSDELIKLEVGLLDGRPICIVRPSTCH